MEEFIETVENESLGEKLRDALGGRGSFGRFRSVVGSDVETQGRWHRFKAEKRKEQAMELVEKPPIELWPEVVARVPVPEDVETGLLAPLRDG